MTRNIKRLFDDDGAVSPVIGVILMVAITVILAAVIGTFVLGLGDQVSQTAPQASISVESTATGTPNTVTFKHGGGDPIPFADLKITFGTGDTVTFTGSVDWTTAQTLQLGMGESGSSVLQSFSGSTNPTVDSSASTPIGTGDFTATFVDEPTGQIVAEKDFTI